MLPELGWTLLALLACSIPLWRLAPGERRRIRFVWALWVLALALWLAAAAPASPRWIAEAVLALTEAIALHLAAVLLFRVILKRLETPRILVELLIGAGYAAIVIGLLTRVGVNLTGLVATSAVVTAVLGFGLQDVLGNLAGGLVLEVEQAISEGDWIRTDQYFGQVRSVRVRHTALETPDGDTILVPNSAITRSPVTVLGRTMATAGGPVKHRRLVTFQLPYSHSPSSVTAAVEQALTASAIEGIAEEPRPRCVIIDFHPQYVQYGALVWIMRPAMEYVDISRVRTRITFALTRMGAPLTPISHVLDMRSGGDPRESMDAETADRLAALRGVEILQCLTEEEARQLAPLMKRTSFTAGEIILRQGDTGDSLYILKRGRVRILLANKSGLSEQVACLNPGDFFGEMSLLTGEARTATALALDEVDCYCLAKADMQALFANRPQLADEISMVLTQREAGLASLRDRLDEAAEKQKAILSRNDLLSRIRRYFEAP